VRESVEIQAGDFFVLPAAIISPSNATNRQLEITVTSGRNVISLDGGVVTALSPGTATDGSGVVALAWLRWRHRGFGVACLRRLVRIAGMGVGVAVMVVEVVVCLIATID